MVFFRQILITSIIIASSVLLFLKDLKLVSATYDEDFSYVRNSIYLVRNLKWDQDYITLHPPLMYYLHGLSFLIFDPKNPVEVLYLSRIAILPLFILFGFALFLITKKIVNEIAGYFVIALYSFNIEILAHARLVTADYLKAISVFGTIISFYYFLKLPNLPRLFLAGLFLGIALISKYSALMLIPIYLVIFLIFVLKKEILLKNSLKILAILAIAILITHSAYFFKESGKIPQTYKNTTVRKIYDNQSTRLLLYLLPRAYIGGVDLQTATSQSVWWGYFAGKPYYYGLWYFYPVAFILKTQIPLLVFIVLAILMTIKRREFTFLDLTLVGSVLFFFVYFSFFNKLIVGLRYLLMVYPLLFLFSAKIFRLDLSQRRDFSKLTIFIIFILIYVFQAWHISPHYLAYANELIGGPGNSYKYFADSNLDWNQNTIFFQKYLDSHPEITAINPKKPTSGKIAVSVNEMNLYYYYDYSWLRNLKKEPVEHIGYTWLIFDIKSNEISPK